MNGKRANQFFNGENMTNHSAPAAPADLSIASNTNDATSATRQNLQVQDGCGSCTLVIAASILVLGLSVALYLHKEKRDSVPAAVPSKTKPLVQYYDPASFFLVA